MIFPLLALVGLGLLLSKRSGTTSVRLPTTPAAPIAREAERIIRESREIIDGKREAYSAVEPDDEPSSSAPSSSAPSSSAQPSQTTAPPGSGMARPPLDDDDEEAQALAAAKRAAAEERGLPPPKPTMTVGPIRTKPAPKPAPSRGAPRPAPAKPAARVPAKPAARTPARTAPASRPPPPGTDLALAKSTAPKVAAHLKQKGARAYDHTVLKLWQTRAGIGNDGIYGRGAATALKYFTPAAPAAFVQQGVAQYTPPKG